MVGWRIEPAERYPNGVDDIIEAIHDDLVWVAVTSKYAHSSLNFFLVTDVTLCASNL
jgi:hypothetical protein